MPTGRPLPPAVSTAPGTEAERGMLPTGSFTGAHGQMENTGSVSAGMCFH